MDDLEQKKAIRTMADDVASLVLRLGISPKTFQSMGQDTDWAYLIKLHSLLEASINHLLVRYFQDDRLEDAFSAMEMGDDRRGKIAFLKALKIVPPASISFIKKLGSIRNKLAHKVADMDFQLTKYLKSLGADQRNALVGTIQEELPGTDVKSLLDKDPRHAFFAVTCLILFQIEDLINLRKSTLKGEGRAGASDSLPPESSPKEP